MLKGILRGAESKYGHRGPERRIGKIQAKVSTNSQHKDINASHHAEKL